jgi:hypothetical protein
MSASAGPDIITDGLVLCLDAGNRDSYPGSGNTWRDLVGSNNGTLTNGPTFSNANGGSIVFDGANDQIDCGDIDILGGATSLTTEVWLKPGIYTSGPWRAVLTTWNDPSAGLGHTWVVDLKYRTYSVFFRTTELGAYPTEYQGNSNSIHFPDNTWVHFVVTYNGANITIYANANIIGTHSKTGTIANKNANEKLKFGVDRNTTAPYNGVISNIKIYKNRALTPQEVLQNYNATKGRFGLA